jgi:hypothetical protein
LGIKLQPLEVRTSGSLDGAFAAIARETGRAPHPGRPCVSAQSEADDGFRYRDSALNEATPSHCCTARALQAFHRPAKNKIVPVKKAKITPQPSQALYFS